MVPVKNYAFKVQPQRPDSQAGSQAYGSVTVINCRQPAGRRAAKRQKEPGSRQVPFAIVDGTLKRKRGAEGEDTPDAAPNNIATLPASASTSTSTTSTDPLVSRQRWQPPRPARARKPKVPTRGVDLDCWFTIMSFSDPAQLLMMRRGVPSCHRFLRDNPMLWKLSRNYYYGCALPEPTSELTEFQYADLRHDHGCMSCRAPSTRKTYWAYLRRWCKSCLHSKAIKEHDAMDLLRNVQGEDLSFLHKCIPAGIFDSWGNFVGVGPATTHALKTAYLLSDVQKVISDYISLKAQNTDTASWNAELAAWYEPKVKLVEERQDFAHKMEGWEESMRNERTYDYSTKKAARKKYFQAKAAELDAAISVREMECCPSYRRAVAIPKDPNNTSWLQLKPKLEKEVAELRAKGGPPENRLPSQANTGTSTPTTIEQPQGPFMLPPIGFALGYHMGFGPPPNHNHNHNHFY
jgi:hypothetical protein